MDQFSFQYPAWYLLLCLFIALAAALLMYFRTSFFSTHPFFRKALLAALRFLAVFILAALTLNPLFKMFKKEIKKPVLVIAEDHSRSMIEKDSSWVDRYAAMRRDALARLSEKYTCLLQGFSDKSTPLPENFALGKNSFQGKKSDLSSALDWIKDHVDLQQLKGIIVLTDGIHNSGKNPLYHSLSAAFPMYPLMTGDTIVDKDLAIPRVYHNELVYAGDKFSVECDVQAWNLANEKAEVRLEKWVDKKWSTIDKFTFSIGSNHEFQDKELVIETSQPEIARFRFVCDRVANERNIRNNQHEFFVEILDAKKKVLILCHSPHPDIGAIKDALAANKNYEVVVKYADDPVDKTDGLTLAILHQLPGLQAEGKNWMQALQTKQVPLMFIVGSKTNLNLFNSAQNIVQINGANNSFNEALPLYQPTFSSFTTSDELVKMFNNYPPLAAPFGTYRLDPTAHVLCKQKIGKVDTDYPLIVVAKQQGLKHSYILGEGIWKWRFQDFIQSQSFDPFYELITKLIQFTCAKDDKRRFKVTIAKRILDENETVKFNGEFYNDAYERINTPDVRMKIKDQNGLEYDYQFSKKEDYYELNAYTLPAGEYQYFAAVTWSGTEWKDSGVFSIRALDYETANLTADWAMLRLLAVKSGGLAFKWDEMEKLVELLANNQAAKPIIYQNLEVKPLLEKWWIFMLIFLCLATEWFLRRWWGSY